MNFQGIFCASTHFNPLSNLNITVSLLHHPCPGCKIWQGLMRVWQDRLSYGRKLTSLSTRPKTLTNKPDRTGSVHRVSYWGGFHGFCDRGAKFQGRTQDWVQHLGRHLRQVQGWVRVCWYIEHDFGCPKYPIELPATFCSLNSCEGLTIRVAQ